MESGSPLQSWLLNGRRLVPIRMLVSASFGDGRRTLLDRLLSRGEDARRQRAGTGDGWGDYQGRSTVARRSGTQIFDCEPRRIFLTHAASDVPDLGEIASAASNADVALMIIDVRRGLSAQTRRLVLACAVMGVRHWILAVNKMDLAGFDAERFNAVAEAFRAFAANSGASSVHCIPVSALLGDNIVDPSAFMGWYSGPTLVSHLRTTDFRDRDIEVGLQLPVQYVVQTEGGIRAVCGRLKSGWLWEGTRVCVMPSGEAMTTAAVFNGLGRVRAAGTGDCVSVLVDGRHDVRRGDVLVNEEASVNVANEFDATLLWLSPSPMASGTQCEILLESQMTAATVCQIKARLDPVTGYPRQGGRLAAGEIGHVRLVTRDSLVHAKCHSGRALRGFVLVDRVAHRTVGAGTINSGPPVNSHGFERC